MQASDRDAALDLKAATYLPDCFDFLEELCVFQS